jgi:hypothetical protein
MNVFMLGVTDWLKQKLFGGILEEVGWLMIGFKIVVLLVIVGFVRSRFGSGPLVTILTLAIGYIVLFQQWYIFGPVMFIYLFIIFGFSAILIDIAITRPWTKHAWRGGGEEGMGVGAGYRIAEEDATGSKKMHELGEVGKRRQMMFRGRF